MYVEDFNTFYQQAQELVAQQPLRTRYVIKYKHKEGKLVLKVTDDVVCLKYKTDQQIDVKKMEKLNSLFFVLMARGEHPTDEELMATAEQLGSQSVAAAAPSKGRGGGGGGGGGSGKNRRKG
ncbi:hypothetical protein OEZ86_006616 [Tetradesmus obliquus]|uniref:Uncharacterized protein n=2 Tax=Tetradesmus obliquus TaxID=3088 RepID=A0ABY8TW50_TETOB|nr:hypothetical protein OEZ85_006931 [Tetradesmus obliquus]WIA33488.1 hypothetical protein OEZ86_006616 [Tetradesmus obliquus]|eukprot:jgi/Sobl393_1/13473/SZX63176.1